MRAPAQKSLAWRVVVRSLGRRRSELLAAFLAVMASSALLTFSLAAAWGAGTAWWDFPLAGLAVSVSLAQVWLVLRPWVQAEAPVLRQLEAQGASPGTVRLTVAGVTGGFSALATALTLALLLLARGTLVKLAGLTSTTSGPGPAAFLALLYATVLVLAVLVAAFAGTPCRTRTRDSIPSRVIWGVAATFLALEAVTIGSQRWFDLSTETFTLGMMLLVLGLVILLPAVYVLVARACNDLVFALRPMSARTASSWPEDTRAGEAATAMALALSLLVALTGTPHDATSTGTLPWQDIALFVGTYAVAVVFWATWPLTRSASLGYERLWGLGAGGATVASLALRHSLIVALFQSLVGGVVGAGVAAALRSFVELGGTSNSGSLWPWTLATSGVALVVCVATWVLAALTAPKHPRA